jgi:hypothetical protein
MKITKDEYETLVKMVTKFLEDLEEHGVPSAVVSISVEHEEWGWFASHWNAGDPLACRGLASDYLDDEDSDDGIFMYRGEPNDDGGGFSESFGG